MPAMDALATTLAGWWEEHVAPEISGDIILRQVRVTDMTTATSPSTTLVLSDGGITGGRSDNALPNNVALSVSFRTNGRGRSSRGRNYVVGLCEPDVTGNQINSVKAAFFETAYNALIAIMSDTPFTWVVASKYASGAPRTTALIADVTAALIVDRFIDSMRRRLAGRGK